MNDILFPFGLIILAGAAFRRFRVGGLDADSLRLAISVSVFNVFLPALCIKITATSAMDREAVLVPATAWLSIIIAMTLSLALYTILQKSMQIDQREKGVLVLAASFGNVTYLGLPVLTGLYGPEAAKYALYYDLLAASPLLWLAGAPLASRYGENRGFAIREALITIASLPPLWGIVAGVLLNLADIPLPPFFLKTLGMLGDLVVPLMIFSIGLALSLPKVRHAYTIVPAVFIKLAVFPVISYTIAVLLGLKGTGLASCLIEGAMPTMILLLLIAERFRLNVSLAAFIIVITTIISFVTLPFAVHLTKTLVY